MTFSITILLIIILIVLLLIIMLALGISTQRKLVHSDELCSNALSQIGVQQTSRWDALTSIAKLTKDYSAHKYETLMAVISKRQNITGKSALAEIDTQETLLNQVAGKLIAIGAAYPDLKANTVYITSMNNINNYENKVRISRMTYNDTITKYNRLVRQFPSSVFANMMGFSVRDYLESDNTKSEMPAF